MTTAAVRNEQRKLLANALNNVGVAAVVTGVIAPGAAYLLDTLVLDDPLRLLALVVIWTALGMGFMNAAQHVLKGLE